MLTFGAFKSSSLKCSSKRLWSSALFASSDISAGVNEILSFLSEVDTHRKEWRWINRLAPHNCWWSRHVLPRKVAIFSADSVMPKPNPHRKVFSGKRTWTHEWYSEVSHQIAVSEREGDKPKIWRRVNNLKKGGGGQTALFLTQNRGNCNNKIGNIYSDHVFVRTPHL